MMLTVSWSKIKNEHVCATLVLASGERLYYRDTRRFGRLCFCTVEAAKAYLSKVQPDMFTLTLDEFIAGMHRKNAVLSSVGNYVAAETLYRVCIHPRAKIGKLTDDDLETLLERTLRAVEFGLWTNENEPFARCVHRVWNVKE